MAHDSAGRSMPRREPRHSGVVGRYAPVHLLSEAWQNPLSDVGANSPAEIAFLSLRRKSAH
jgi:hypothetical protein